MTDESENIGMPHATPAMRANFEHYMPEGPPNNDNVWLWRGSVLESGYGRLRIGGGKTVRAHRAAFMLFNGPIPPNTIVRHTSDTPLDVNPRHLILGTHADNIHDMVERGRHLHGARHHSATLTPDLVRELRLRHAAGESYPALAHAYGITHRAVVKVVKRLSWAHID